MPRWCRAGLRRLRKPSPASSVSTKTAPIPCLPKNGTLTGEVGTPILGQQAKVDALTEITQRLGISQRDVLAVGDGANDLGMLKAAGTGVALHAKPSVAAQCDIRINHGDLTALLFLQGYGEQDFVQPP